MTYTTSHLGASTILLFSFAPKKMRVWIKENPRTLFFTSLFAILPDVDIYLQIPHRTWTHSIFLILFTAIALLSIANVSSNTKLQQIALLITYFWLSHIFFDLTWDSVGIFYPFDKSFYKVVGGVNLDLTTSTVSISGIYLQTALQNPDKGIDQYFVNWSAERRVSTFGSSEVVLVIEQLTVHIAVFIFYFFKVIVPFFLSFDKISNQISKINIISPVPSIQRFMKFGWMTLILILLLIFSLFAGVGTGESYSESSGRNITFYTLSDGLSLYSTVNYNVPAKASAKITVKFNTHALNFSIAFGASNSTVRDESKALLDEYAKNRDNISYSTFAKEYINSTSKLIPRDWINYEVNPLEGLSFKFYFPYSVSSQSISFDFMLNGWNISNYFIYTVKTTLSYEISRADEVNTFNLLSIFSLVAMISTLVFSYRRKDELKVKAEHK